MAESASGWRQCGEGLDVDLRFATSGDFGFEIVVRHRQRRTYAKLFEDAAQ
jgi:hypothetical protein